MDQDGPPPPRRRKFAPKAPVRRKQNRPAPLKTGESNNDGESAEALRLLRQFNDTLGRGGPKVEKKSSVEVSFGPGAESSGSIRSFGVAKEGSSRRKSSSSTEPKCSNNEEPALAHMSVKEGGFDDNSADFTDPSASSYKKDYTEPWDYNSYYPTTLPWRGPYSGNQELLDEEEFGESATNSEYDENNRKSAPELGLLEESEEKKMLFFQFPSNLPLSKQTSGRKGKEKARELGSLDPSGASNTNWGLEYLPGGYMGKMLVYRSGAVKLKLGDVLYDVSPGSEISFAQDVVAIDRDEKRFCVLGELRKRAVVTPDVESVLNSVIDLS